MTTDPTEQLAAARRAAAVLAQVAAVDADQLGVDPTLLGAVDDLGDALRWFRTQADRLHVARVHGAAPDHLADLTADLREALGQLIGAGESLGLLRDLLDEPIGAHRG